MNKKKLVLEIPSNLEIDQISEILGGGQIQLKELVEYADNVPLWKDYGRIRDMDNYSVELMSNPQMFFYEIFKNAFIKQTYFDVEENEMYVIMLFFYFYYQFKRSNYKDVKCIINFIRLKEYYPVLENYVEIEIGYQTEKKEVKKNKKKFQFREPIESIQKQPIKEVVKKKKEEKIIPSQTPIAISLVIPYELNENGFFAHEVVPIKTNDERKSKYIVNQFDVCSNDIFNKNLALTFSQSNYYYRFQFGVEKGEFLDIGESNGYVLLLFLEKYQIYQKESYAVKFEIASLLLKLKYYYPEHLKHITFSVKEMEMPMEIYSDRLCYGLGNFYKNSLKLDINQVLWLNEFYTPLNQPVRLLVFVQKQVVQILLSMYDDILHSYKEKNESLAEKTAELIHLMVTKFHRYRRGSSNYRYSTDHYSTKLKNSLFNIAQNKVLSIYGGRLSKIYSIDEHPNKDLRTAFDEYMSIVNKAIDNFTGTIEKLPRTIDAELTIIYPNRYRHLFTLVKEEFKEDAPGFFTRIEKLQEITPLVNQKTILYDSSKFIFPYDKMVSLKFYLKYLLVVFDLKEKSKTLPNISKMFEDLAQRKRFETVKTEFEKDKNIEKAFENVEGVFVEKRKKIVLDISTISEVIDKHSETVDLLNQYLQEDESQQTIHKKVEKPVKKELEKSTPKKEKSSSFNLEVTPVQEEVILLIATTTEFSVSQKKIAEIATKNGMFKNQLIEQINDLFYELLDDVLIEEEDENYTIIENYYYQILVK